MSKSWENIHTLNWEKVSPKKKDKILFTFRNELINNCIQVYKIIFRCVVITRINPKLNCLWLTARIELFIVEFPKYSSHLPRTEKNKKFSLVSLTGGIATKNYTYICNSIVYGAAVEKKSRMRLLVRQSISRIIFESGRLWLISLEVGRGANQEPRKSTK